MKYGSVCALVPLCAILAAPATAAPHIELTGVLAASRDSDSLALVSVDAGPARLVRVNAVLPGGVRLVAVSPLGATLSDGRVLRLTRSRAPRIEPAIMPVARTVVTSRAPDQRAGAVEQIHVSQVE